DEDHPAQRARQRHARQGNPAAGPGHRGEPVQQAPHRLMRQRRHLAATPWLFLLPGLVVTLVFTVYPFLNTAVLSFTDAKVLGGGAFTGFANFQKMIDDPMFWVALRNSALYVVGVVPFLVVLPLLVALLVQKHIPGMTFFRAAFFTPVVASIVVVGLIW